MELHESDQLNGKKMAINKEPRCIAKCQWKSYSLRNWKGGERGRGYVPKLIFVCLFMALVGVG